MESPFEFHTHLPDACRHLIHIANVQYLSNTSSKSINKNIPPVDVFNSYRMEYNIYKKCIFIFYQ